MNTKKILGTLVFMVSISFSIGQTVDLSSVDEFFKITTNLKEGKEIVEEQWACFDSSRAYSAFAERENKFALNTIKSTIHIVFSKDEESEIDSILNISRDEMIENKELLFKKLILLNFLDVKDNFDSIRLFRNEYDFIALVEKAKLRLSTFLGLPDHSISSLKPIYFLFILADGLAGGDAFYIDFNLFFKQTEEQRTNFLAHEFFHDYRKRFENYDFINHCELNATLDGFQNEGIADLIDKSEGYNKCFKSVDESPEMIQTWDSLYNHAQRDLERFHDLTIKYSKGEIAENKMVDEIFKIVKFNGHSIGFFMANQIVKAGYEDEMFKTFFNPYNFFNLYNKAANDLDIFQLNNEFMEYLRNITKDYYR